MSEDERIELTDEPDSAADAFVEDPEHAIRLRAYDISQREDAGTAEENWRRAQEQISSE